MTAELARLTAASVLRAYGREGLEMAAVVCGYFSTNNGRKERTRRPSSLMSRGCVYKWARWWDWLVGFLIVQRDKPPGWSEDKIPFFLAWWSRCWWRKCGLKRVISSLTDLLRFKGPVCNNYCNPLERDGITNAYEWVYRYIYKWSGSGVLSFANTLGSIYMRSRPTCKDPPRF